MSGVGGCCIPAPLLLALASGLAVDPRGFLLSGKGPSKKSLDESVQGHCCVHLGPASCFVNILRSCLLALANGKRARPCRPTGKVQLSAGHRTFGCLLVWSHKDGNAAPPLRLT